MSSIGVTTWLFGRRGRDVFVSFPCDVYSVHIVRRRMPLLLNAFIEVGLVDLCQLLLLLLLSVIHY